MTKTQQPTVVVVGVDYSETGDLAFDQALRLCNTVPEATLHVVNVADMILGANLEQALIQDPERLLSEAAARLTSYVEKRASASRAEGGRLPRIVTHVRWEAPGEEIAQLAADLEADLVVVGTHGRRGLSRVMMGSVAEVVARLSPCPVLVVRPKGLTKAPAIEPPCPECLKTRAATAGASYWCEQHRQRHGQRHTYYNGDRISADGTFPLLFHGGRTP